MDDPDLDSATRQLLMVHRELKDDIRRLIEQVRHNTQVLANMSQLLDRLNHGEHT